MNDPACKQGSRRYQTIITCLLSDKLRGRWSRPATQRRAIIECTKLTIMKSRIPHHNNISTNNMLYVHPDQETWLESMHCYTVAYWWLCQSYLSKNKPKDIPKKHLAHVSRSNLIQWVQHLSITYPPTHIQNTSHYITKVIKTKRNWINNDILS